MLVLTPGLNMIYLLSRSIVQGRETGLISLLGVLLGFLVHMTLAAFSLTAVFLAIPYVHDVVKFAGAALTIKHGRTLKRLGRRKWQGRCLA